jgi:methylated-DNA-[protein]-cysteine S-methyltransferase
VASQGGLQRFSGRVCFRDVMGTSYVAVETAIGAFGVAWTDAGIVRTWLHAGTVTRARQQILRACPGALESAPPPGLAATISEVRSLLSGEPVDLLSAELDMTNVPDFDRRVYELARTIGPGSTTTYGEIAKALGEEPMRARDVGVALARNCFAPIVPCHRVVAAGGRLGGYSAPGGTRSPLRDRPPSQRPRSQG